MGFSWALKVPGRTCPEPADTQKRIHNSFSVWIMRQFAPSQSKLLLDRVQPNLDVFLKLPAIEKHSLPHPQIIMCLAKFGSDKHELTDGNQKAKARFSALFLQALIDPSFSSKNLLCY
jgi:hypothetical protein